jgi:oxepin-CoA hydrolase/3-oxo-5,6-dehydrosuberyl-CoA semialdehyde dehydrogenase
MGPLVDLGQRDEVIERVKELSAECDVVLDGPGEFEPQGGSYSAGAFIKPSLLYCDKPLDAKLVHSVEAFGPVSTILPYDSSDEGLKLANMGEGSLVSSVFSNDKGFIRSAVMGIGPYHGRLVCIDRTSAGESTGHGAPMPHMKHGGPGRAGGGEELGGVRSIKHYMQRVAIQGSPDVLTKVTNRWIPGSQENELDVHPFRKNFNDIQIGDTLNTGERQITLEDVAHFAEFSGDNFYAHTDDEAAAANPFFEGKVAHGYLQLAFAAGLFVDPAPGPVLANYGLTNLSFSQPVYPGDVMKVRLVCKQKTVRKGAVFGEVRWDVTITNQDDEVCANYELLTLNERIGDD